jgi:hypothetical protein
VNRKKTLPSLSSALDNPEGFIAEQFNAARVGADQSVKDVAAYAQLQPEKALLWALGAGYLLRMLPLTGIVGGLVRLLLALLKPAALIYGAAKVWQKAKPFVAAPNSTANP